MVSVETIGTRPTRLMLRAAQPWATLVVRLGLAFVWLSYGYHKALNPDATVVAVRAYRILPEALVRPFAYALPFVEIVLGLLILVGFAIRFSGIISSLLIVMFMIGIISVWARGYTISCGCNGGGGDATTSDYPLELLRDAGYLVMSLWLVVFPRSRLAFDPFAPPAPVSVEAGGETLDEE
jgi:uncharacterized membrane protein YphA (DoxX/SURF4 family)